MNSPNTQVVVSAATQFALANFIELFHKDAEAAERFNPDQIAFPFLGEVQAIEAFMDERETLNQAIDAFMVEREELVSAVQDQRSIIRSCGDDLMRQKEEIETSNAVLLHVAEYATLLQHRLNSIGISFAPGEDGTPHITVDHAAFDAAFAGI
jgi:hypothetical protein